MTNGDDGIRRDDGIGRKVQGDTVGCDVRIDNRDCVFIHDKRKLDSRKWINKNGTGASSPSLWRLGKGGRVWMKGGGARQRGEGVDQRRWRAHARLGRRRDEETKMKSKICVRTFLQCVIESAAVR